jgi:predicted methyltransferase
LSSGQRPLLITQDVVEAIQSAAQRGDDRAAVSFDLRRSVTTVEPTSDGWRLDGRKVRFPDRVRDRTIYALEGIDWAPVARYGSALYKLVPTDWGPPTFEIDGIKMLVSQKISPIEDAKNKIRLVDVGGARLLDTCGGLGYFAVAALEAGCASIRSFEKSPEVRWLRTQNPWSPSADPRFELTAGDVTEHVGAFPDRSFDVILHDPPRFGIAGELYAGRLYETFARLLSPRGRLFHYTGTPNRLTSGRDVPGEVAKRLAAAGFRSVRREGDGLVARLR